MILLVSFFLYFVLGLNGLQKNIVFQSFSVNLFTFLYAFHNWSFSPFYIFNLNLFGVTLNFGFTPFSVWIFFILLYIQFITYVKTNHSLPVNIYIILSTFISFLYCFLNLHTDFMPIFLYFTMIILGVFLIFLYLYVYKIKKNNLQVLVSELDKEPHIPTRFANVTKAFIIIPVPVSSQDILQRFFYYDLIFGFISFFGFLKTHFILVLLCSNYCFGKTSFYLFLSATVWVGVSLGLLVFDTKWSEDFRLYNGEKVLYLLGYNNIYTNLYKTLFTAGISGLIISLIGLVDQAQCSPWPFTGWNDVAPDQAQHTVSIDSSEKQITLKVKVNQCEAVLQGHVDNLEKIGEEGKKLSKTFKEIGCDTTPVAQRAGDTSQRVVESWAANPKNKPDSN